MVLRRSHIIKGGQLMSKVLFPGTFDPITRGHLDLVERAARIFDEVYVVIMDNNEKSSLLDVNERFVLMKQSFQHLPNVILDSYDGLSVQYAQEHDIAIMLRGVRTIHDYDYEMQIAAVNTHLDPSIETMFLLAKPEYAFISSSTVKAVAVQHGNIQALVEPHVENFLNQHFHK